MTKEKFNIYEEITNRIIKQLEAGTIPWHKPWSGVATGAFNRVSKKPYSLLNQMLLQHEGEYATFKQWSALGGKIKKGEKSEIVVFWKILESEKVNDKGEKEKQIIPMLRYYSVFHISQIEGVEPISKPQVQHEPIKEGEEIKNNYKARENLTINEIVTNRAFYNPSGDYIEVPCKEQYSDIAEYFRCFGND